MRTQNSVGPPRLTHRSSRSPPATNNSNSNVACSSRAHTHKSMPAPSEARLDVQRKGIYLWLACESANATELVGNGDCDVVVHHLPEGDDAHHRAVQAGALPLHTRNRGGSQAKDVVVYTSRIERPGGRWEWRATDE
jgi:hypothetical protein